MKALLLPLLLAALGAAAGVGAGLYLRPQTGVSGPESTPPAGAESDIPSAEPPDERTMPGLVPAPDRDRPPIDQLDFVRLTNQFVVPVLRRGEVRALVVVSVGLEISAGTRDVVFAREPKLRDAFLRVLFDHANAGTFDGTFTAGPPMQALRQALWEAARPILGSDIHDVLITDIARQDA
jgi:hypothetical protein